jgi:glycosyltransferase involved in cell wall biosynthesis
MIADPHIPIPPVHYGGTERIVHLYAEFLARSGHKIDIIAADGSSAYGGEIYIHRAPSKKWISRAQRKFQFQLQSLLAAQKCDIVFNFGRFDYLETLLMLGLPILHCFQNPIDQGQIDFAESRVRGPFGFLLLSKNQASHAKINFPSHVLPNPVDCTGYQCGEGKGGYLAFLGRLTYNKGVDIAIKVAKRTGKALKIAGNISQEEGGPEFFQQAVQPYLNNQDIQWIGPINDMQKRGFLADASALLFPIRWDEPFGIVMAEALACGTPVIAMNKGSTSEVLDHGCTGFLCSTEDEMVEAVNALSTITRSDCRIMAETRFDIRVLAPQVLRILSKLASLGALP